VNRSVAELAKEVEGATGLVASPMPGDPANMPPPAPRLLWLKQVLTELGVGVDFLAGADELATTARSMRTDAVMASQQASQRRAAALSTLADGPVGRDR
jgi:hypothetical protein